MVVRTGWGRGEVPDECLHHDGKLTLLFTFPAPGREEVKDGGRKAKGAGIGMGSKEGEISMGRRKMRWKKRMKEGEKNERG